MQKQKPLLYCLSGNNEDNNQRKFHGAAILTDNGLEIPITADMINKALVEAHDFLSPSNLKIAQQAC